MTTRPIFAALALFAAASLAAGDVITERWTTGGGRHKEQVEFSSAGGGTVIKFDLADLKDAKVHRARLHVNIKAGGFPQPLPLVVKPLTAPAADEGEPTVEDKALELMAPRYTVFDATDLVRRWQSKKLANNGVLFRGAQPVRGRCYLEITYDGKMPGVAAVSAASAGETPATQFQQPAPATGLQAFYRAGQVFLTWKEINNPFANKDTVTWKEYKADVDRLRDGKGDITSYRIYRHTKPVTAANLGEAELLDEVNNYSACDEAMVKTEWKGEQIKNVKVDDAPVPRIGVEEKKLLAPAVGVFAKTCTKDGEFYYAVVSAVNGVENTTALNAENTTKAIAEKVAPTEPVLLEQVPMMYQKERTLNLYIWFVEAPLSNLPRFVHVGVSTGPKLAKQAPPVLVEGYWWSGGWNTVHPAPQEDGLTLAIDDHPWHVRGIHEANGTYKSWGQGKVQNFYIRQIKALLPWVKAKWDADMDRVYAYSGDWAWHYPEVFAATFEVLTTNPKRSPAMPEVRLYWNDPKTPPETEWGMSPYEYWNAGEWIRKNPKAELAHMSYTPYQHTGDFGRLDKPAFFAAMRDTKRAFATIFDEGRGWSGTYDINWIFQIRKSDSIAAFTNCNLDDNPGIGIGGDPGGQINAWLAFDARGQVDSPERWEMTLYLLDKVNNRPPGAPLDKCTADVTPRRCQKYTAKPGEKFTWTNTSLADNKVVQNGQITADENGLVTAPNVVIAKTKNRLVIERAK